MSNRRKSVFAKRRRGPRIGPCPKCGSRQIHSREYNDAWLHVCTDCKFPWRSKKSKRRQLA